MNRSGRKPCFRSPLRKSCTRPAAWAAPARGLKTMPCRSTPPVEEKLTFNTLPAHAKPVVESRQAMSKPSSSTPSRPPAAVPLSTCAAKRLRVALIHPVPSAGSRASEHTAAGCPCFSACVPPTCRQPGSTPTRNLPATPLRSGGRSWCDGPGIRCGSPSRAPPVISSSKARSPGRPCG